MRQTLRFIPYPPISLLKYFTRNQQQINYLHNKNILIGLLTTQQMTISFPYSMVKNTHIALSQCDSAILLPQNLPLKTKNAHNAPPRQPTLANCPPPFPRQKRQKPCPPPKSRQPPPASYHDQAIGERCAFSPPFAQRLKTSNPPTCLWR